jgi:hypothetical protein
MNHTTTTTIIIIVIIIIIIIKLWGLLHTNHNVLLVQPQTIYFFFTITALT